MAETAAPHSSGIKHPYHLVDPSPWPAVGSISIVVLTFGAITFMHPDMWGERLTPMMRSVAPWWLILGFVMVLFTMAGWWRDVVRESRTPGLHTPVVRLGLRYGMFLFISSEVMFFVAFFWSYFHFSLFPEHILNPQIGGVWPPRGVQTFDPWDLPFINTLVLLLSGVTVTWAHHALLENDRKTLVRGLAATVALGVSFTALQAYEYSHAAFGFADNVYSSVFFMATGFHGFHVIVGTIFLAVCLGRAINGHFTPERHFGFEAAAWYWHFVDVVWLFLFACIYWWGAGTPAAH